MPPLTLKKKEIDIAKTQNTNQKSKNTICKK